MKLAEKILESSIAKRIADFEKEQKAGGKDISLIFRGMRDNLNKLKRDNSFKKASNTIDNKRIKELDRIILQLTNMANDAEKIGVVDAIRKNK